MRLKRILAGALAGLMVITSVPAAQLGNGTSYAAEIAYKYAEVDSAILQENAIANSEQYPEQGCDGPAEWAFDEEDSTWWHSRYESYDQIGIHS